MICSPGRSMTILIMQTEKNDYSHYFVVSKSNNTTLRSCHLFLQVELSFRTFSNDGLLVYGGSGGSGTDYFSIKLEDGHLVFEYELGGGPVVLKSAARYLCTYHHGCCICFSSSSHKVRICLEEGLQIGLLAIGTWSMWSAFLLKCLRIST